MRTRSGLQYNEPEPQVESIQKQPTTPTTSNLTIATQPHVVKQDKSSSSITFSALQESAVRNRQKRLENDKEKAKMATETTPPFDPMSLIIKTEQPPLEWNTAIDSTVETLTTKLSSLSLEDRIIRPPKTEKLPSVWNPALDPIVDSLTTKLSFKHRIVRPPKTVSEDIKPMTEKPSAIIKHYFIGGSGNHQSFFDTTITLCQRVGMIAADVNPTNEEDEVEDEPDQTESPESDEDVMESAVHRIQDDVELLCSELRSSGGFIAREGQNREISKSLNDSLIVSILAC